MTLTITDTSNTTALTTATGHGSIATAAATREPSHIHIPRPSRLVRRGVATQMVQAEPARLTPVVARGDR
jgi:hypothetical protein